MSFRTAVMSVVLGLAIALSSSPVAAQRGTWISYQPDPASYSMGWSRAHWIPGLQGMIVFGGERNYKMDNSVRLFRPLSNTWEYLWPDNWTQGLQGREMHLSFYVPHRGALGELWIIGGTYPEGAVGLIDGTHVAGRFDLASRQWVVSESLEQFGLIEGLTLFVSSLAAHDWCGDRAVLFGGADEGNPEQPEQPGTFAGDGASAFGSCREILELEVLTRPAPVP